VRINPDGLSGVTTHSGILSLPIFDRR